VNFFFASILLESELRFLFDLVGIRANFVRFVSILLSFGLTKYVFVRSFIYFY
jgi:hypothetical protein